MRFERLDLAPYGRFTDRRLTLDPDARLHVVFGRNEAGKTTTLEAIKDFLFGFPARTPYAFEHGYDSMRIGAALRFADGARLEARRRKGRSNTLVDEANGAVSEARLRDALAGLTRESFDAEFGLTQATLRAGGAALLATGGRLSETLAAGSASLSALVASRDRLEEEAAALFTRRRAEGKRFYQAADAYDLADRKLREAIVTAEALRLADQRRAEALAAEDRLREEQEEVVARLAKRERASRTQPTIARIDAIARELAELADLAEIDGAALAAARAALDQDRALRATLAQLSAEAEADAREIAARVVDNALIEHGPVIETLRERLSEVRKAAEDLPRRIEARAQAVHQLDDLARRLGLSGHVALLASPPSDADLALARHALDARREASRRRDEARLRWAEAIRRRDELERAVATPADNPEPLRRRLDALAERVADAERLRRETTAHTRKLRDLAEAAARLDPPADPEVLARLTLPTRADVEAFANADQARAQARQVVAREAEKAAQALTQAEAQLKAQEREAAGATRADWLAARNSRDRSLESLGAALEFAEQRREAFEQARALVGAADAIGDRYAEDVGRATRLETAREEVAARRGALERAEAEAARHAAATQTAAADWSALWARAGVPPRAPSAMLRWLDQTADLLERRAELSRERDEQQVLRERVAEARESLAAVLASMGLPAAPDFEAGYREAREECARRQTQFEAAAKATQAQAQAAEIVRLADREFEQREATLRDLDADWRPAMRALRLPEDAQAPAAEAALAAWAGVAVPRTLMEREARSVEGIERDLATFAADVGALVARVEPGLAGATPEAAVARLVARLTDERRIATQRAQFEQAAARRAERRRAEEARREALAPGLAATRARLGATDDEALALALERCERRRELDVERARCARELAQAGDGRGEAELRAEQQGLDASRLAEEIAALKVRREELDAARREATRTARDAEAAQEALARGRDAAGAARDRAEAAGEIVEVAEQWLLRAAARALAARAIERHRREAQDPLISRAGDMFAIATAGGFCGLAVGYDSADRPVLVARRPDGKRTVDLAGLSEGARDQLFLALRLALLERRAGESLPFIGDDLLASFDDERAARTLELLAEFGAKRQTILFTHHARVADLARDLAGVELLEL